MNDFDNLSKESAKHLHMRSMAVIGELLHGDEVSMADAIRVFEATNKRLGLNQTERVDNLPSMSLVINGCSVQIGVQEPQPQEPVQIEVVDNTPPLPRPAPTTAFNIDFSTLSPSDL